MKANFGASCGGASSSPRLSSPSRPEQDKAWSSSSLCQRLLGRCFAAVCFTAAAGAEYNRCCYHITASEHYTFISTKKPAHVPCHFSNAFYITPGGCPQPGAEQPARSSLPTPALRLILCFQTKRAESASPPICCGGSLSNEAGSHRPVLPGGAEVCLTSPGTTIAVLVAQHGGDTACHPAAVGSFWTDPSHPCPGAGGSCGLWGNLPALGRESLPGAFRGRAHHDLRPLGEHQPWCPRHARLGAGGGSG